MIFQTSDVSNGNIKNSIRSSIFYSRFDVQVRLTIAVAKGPFTNTCKGGPDAKNSYRKKIFGPPADHKNFRAPIFL